MRTQPHLGFSRPRRRTSSRSSGAIGGRPGRRRRYVHFFSHQLPVPPKQRRGLDQERGPPFPRQEAAGGGEETRSIRRRPGRLTLRRRTASWWRSTAFSISSAAMEEVPASSRRSLRVTPYTRNQSTGGCYGPLGASAIGVLAPHTRPANTSWRRGLCLSAITDRVQGRGPMAKRGEEARRITPCDRRCGRAGEQKRSDQGLVPDRLLYPETWVVTLDGQVSIEALIERAGISWSAWVATGRRCMALLAFASRRPAATGQR